MADRFRDRVATLVTALFAALQADNDSDAERNRAELEKLLNDNRKNWADIAELFRSGSAQLWPNDGKLRETIAKLLAMFGAPMAGERRTAQLKIMDILRKRKKTWSDLVELLRSASYESWPDQQTENVQFDANVNPVDLLCALLEEYVALQPHEYVTVAAWVVHTHLFDRFTITSRLGIHSPVEDCGKTTLLKLIERTCAKPSWADSTTAAAVFHEVDAQHPTLLIDEAENLDLLRNRHLRAVFNSGHRKGGRVNRLIGGHPRSFCTFSPLAYAMIGRALPLTLLSRSIPIRMDRHDGSRPLRRLDENILDPAIDEAYRRIVAWRRQVQLNFDPEMPAGLRNRAADNWRLLIAIDDACGPPPDWRPSARDAAIILARTDRDEDARVVLLRDIREIFDHCGVDRMSSEDVVKHLNDLDDAMWFEWRGIKGDQPSRKLSQGNLADLLRAFAIRPRSVWPPRRRPGTKSYKGYLRVWFERAWKRYCPDDGTPSQPSNIKRLRVIRSEE